MPSVIETDYLVVGAGAAGMAFTDALIAECDADVVLVDRRHQPGGHWNDAYPFVRLHQSSTHYGVNSRVLGTESIDTTGPNAGFYDRASGVEIAHYYRQVLDEHLLPSGQVRFLGGHDYHLGAPGEHLVTSRLTGRTTEVKVRRRVVDGTFAETSLPSTHTPSFPVDPEAHFIPVNRLSDLAETPTGYTVLGAGKTAMDACCWLLENGVDPDRIRWVRPRDTWMLDRAYMQPLDGVVRTMEGFALGVRDVAECDGIEDLFRRLEEDGQLLRIDQTVPPTMFRGATISQSELAALRQIHRVVRHGKVRSLGADRIVLDGATIDTSRGEVYVDCTAYGFLASAPRPMFEPGLIVMQSVMGGYTAFNAALIGFIESLPLDDVEKNRLCTPVAGPAAPADWIPMMCGGHRATRVLGSVPEVRTWIDRSRLNLMHGLRARLSDPRAQAAITMWATNLDAALLKSDQLYAQAEL